MLGAAASAHRARGQGPGTADARDSGTHCKNRLQATSTFLNAVEEHGRNGDPLETPGTHRDLDLLG